MEQPKDDQRRRQQRKACDSCRRRKVRCDIVQRPGRPCSVCQKSGIECQSTTQWAKPRRRRTARDDGSCKDRPPSRSGIEDMTSRRLSSSVVTEPALTNGSIQNQDDGIHKNVASSKAVNGNSLPPQTGARGTSPAESARAARRAERAERGGNEPLNHTSADHEYHATTISPESRREHLVRSGLARFFRHGIGAGVWGVFDPDDSFRIAYVGTPVSNLAQLVELHRSFRQHHPRRPMFSAADAGAAMFDSISTHSEAGTAHGGFGPGAAGLRALHYPYPPIRPRKPWKPGVDAWGLSCSAQDLAADVSSFPAPEVRDALVAAYFKHVHPVLPTISMPEFLEAYRSPDRPPPLLLFQAVLMAGAHACEHPLVANDRHAVKSILFRRASMLYHTRHETDRIHLMQAATIFTWHVGDGDTVSGGPWYWAGIAVRIGCGLGAHRRSTTLPVCEISQYRRCWWSAFVCEVFSSLETGRPCAVRAEDIDQPPLTEDDMTDTPGQALTPSAAVGGLSASDSMRPDFLNRMVELAYVGLDILSANAPSQDRIIDVAGIDSRLGLWSLRAGLSSATTTADDATTCQLRIHYNLMLLHLHRNLAGGSGASASASQAVRASAARGVIAALESLTSIVGGIASCHFTGVSAATAAGIQLADEIRAAASSRSLLVVIHALEQLARLLRCVALLAQHWPNAEAVRSVFQDLHQEYEGYVTQDLQGEQVIVPDAQLDWNRLLAGVQESHLNGLTADQDWLNIQNWPGMI